MPPAAAKSGGLCARSRRSCPLAAASVVDLAGWCPLYAAAESGSDPGSCQGPFLTWIGYITPRPVRQPSQFTMPKNPGCDETTAQSISCRAMCVCTCTSRHPTSRGRPSRGGRHAFLADLQRGRKKGGRLRGALTACLDVRQTCHQLVLCRRGTASQERGLLLRWITPGLWLRHMCRHATRSLPEPPLPFLSLARAAVHTSFHYGQSWRGIARII